MLHTCTRFLAMRTVHFQMITYLQFFGINCSWAISIKKVKCFPYFLLLLFCKFWFGSLKRHSREQCSLSMWRLPNRKMAKMLRSATNWASIHAPKAPPLWSNSRRHGIQFETTCVILILLETLLRVFLQSLHMPYVKDFSKIKIQHLGMKAQN